MVKLFLGFWSCLKFGFLKIDVVVVVACGFWCYPFFQFLNFFFILLWCVQLCCVLSFFVHLACDDVLNNFFVLEVVVRTQQGNKKERKSIKLNSGVRRRTYWNKTEPTRVKRRTTRTKNLKGKKQPTWNSYRKVHIKEPLLRQVLLAKAMPWMFDDIN